jgi:protein arginine N-methyltransferase 1
MYSIRSYGEMIRDAPRMDAYVRALRQAVRPGCVVADIGTGTGIFALLACRFGARRVFAVDPSRAVDLARQIADDNGMADRIEFLQAPSTEVTLPECADVIVSDLRGILPLHQEHLVAIIDARRRLLAPGGVMIPQRDTLWAAVVEAPDIHANVNAPWLDNAYGLDMSAGSRVLANSFHKFTPARDQLVTSPALLANLDYETIDVTDVRAYASMEVARAVPAHGICMWFESTLTPGVTMSNAPGEPSLIYKNAFFPWPEAVDLMHGDEVRLDMRADLVGGEYLWTWNSLIVPRGGGEPRARFNQSEFFGEIHPGTLLPKRAASYVAALGEDGKVQRFILDEMARGAPLGDIARGLAEAYPKRFPRWEDALAQVGEVSVRFSE